MKSSKTTSQNPFNPPPRPAESQALYLVFPLHSPSLQVDPLFHQISPLRWQNQGCNNPASIYCLSESTLLGRSHDVKSSRCRKWWRSCEVQQPELVRAGEHEIRMPLHEPDASQTHFLRFYFWTRFYRCLASGTYPC